jgi:hypothetical protein
MWEARGRWPTLHVRRFNARTQCLPEPAWDLRALRADLDAVVKASGPSHLAAVSGANCSLVQGTLCCWPDVWAGRVCPPVGREASVLQAALEVSLPRVCWRADGTGLKFLSLNRYWAFDVRSRPGSSSGFL